MIVPWQCFSLSLQAFDLFVSFSGGFDMNTGKTVFSRNNVNY